MVEGLPFFSDLAEYFSTVLSIHKAIFKMSETSSLRFLKILWELNYLIVCKIAAGIWLTEQEN